MQLRSGRIGRTLQRPDHGVRLLEAERARARAHVFLERLVQCILFLVGPDIVHPATAILRVEIRRWRMDRAVDVVAVRKLSFGAVVVQQRQPDLIQVIRTLHSPRRLHRRQQQRNQDPGDGDHHQEFD